MIRSFCVLVVLVGLAGCGVSVQHTQIGPRAFFIEADGDHADEEDALAAVHDRARELCPQGYGIAQTTSSEWNRYNRGGYATAWHKKSHASLAVECAPVPQTCATPSCGPTAAR